MRISMLNKFNNPTADKLVGHTDAAYSKKSLSKWNNLKLEKYETVIPLESGNVNLSCQVETTFATVIAVSTDVAPSAIVTANCNYDTNTQYSTAQFGIPLVTKTPSSPILNIVQILHKVAEIPIDEKSLQCVFKDGVADYTSCFEAAKPFTMPNKDEPKCLFHSLDYTAPLLHMRDDSKCDRRFYLSKENFDKAKTKEAILNKMTSFNRSVYIRFQGRWETTTIVTAYAHQDIKGGKSTRDYKYTVEVNTRAGLTQFAVPLTPIMTVTAFELLEKHPWVYAAGFDLSILPLGCSVSTILTRCQEYKVTGSQENTVEVNTHNIQKQHNALDWDQEEYDKQKKIHLESLLRPEDSDSYVKALFTIDPLEFTGEPIGVKDIGSISKFLVEGDFKKNISGYAELPRIFLDHCILIKEYDETLYAAISKTFFRELSANTNFASLLSIEAFGYLQEFARIAVMANIEAKSPASKLALDIEISVCKAAFVRATFNSMDKSNFIQISRALTAFFVKFEEMTNFSDAEAKLKFYRLLIEKTINNDKLSLKGIEGYAQIELFRLFKLLDKAAAHGPQLLELQLELIRDKNKGPSEESDISIGVYGDLMPHQIMDNSIPSFNGSANSLVDITFDSSNLALIDPLMEKLQREVATRTEIFLENPKDTHIGILGWISRRLVTNEKLFGTSNIEHKIIVYKNIRQVILKINALVEARICDESVSRNFSSLCKLYIQHSLSPDIPIVNEVLAWLEQLKEIAYSRVEDILKDGDPIIESGKFRALLYDYYAKFSPAPTKVKKDIECLQGHEYEIITFNLINDAAISEHTFLSRIEPNVSYYKLKNLLVHNKLDAQSKSSIEADLLRYKKLWSIQKSVKAHVIADVKERRPDKILSAFFATIGEKLTKILQEDSDVSDKERFKKLQNYKFSPSEKIDVSDIASKNLKAYEDAVIDTRFLSLRALCFDIPDDLQYETEQAGIVDWLNAWLDNCDFANKCSEFEPVAYSKFKEAVAGVKNYRQLSNAMDSLFPDITYITDREFSLENILKGPKKIPTEVYKPYTGCDISYVPLDFFRILGRLITKSGLGLQKDAIFYNAIYKLFEHRIYRSQIAIFKNGTMHTIEFEDPEKLTKFTQVICDNYLRKKNSNHIPVDLLFNEVTRYIEFAVPLLESSGGDAKILHFYEAFIEIYGEHLRAFFNKIQSYKNILQDAPCEKFPANSIRETSVANFYAVLINTAPLWNLSDSKDKGKYFVEFHKYLDKILGFGVLSQELNGHNFTAIMQTALGLLGNPNLGKDLEKFDNTKHKSAAWVFDRLAQIAQRREDCLVFEYFAHLTESKNVKLFSNLADQLSQSSDSLEELIYNIHYNLYEDRFEALSLIIESGVNLSLLNCILANHYGEAKEALITNIKDLRDLLTKLYKVKDQDIPLLKRYLVPPASSIYGKDKFNELFNPEFNAELCKQNLKGVLKPGRYTFNREEIFELFSQIKGLKDPGAATDGYEKIFKVLNTIETIDDSNFQKQLADIDKEDPSNDLMLAAYIIDGVHRTTGKIMRPVQIAALLLSIQGNGNLFNRIKTGQGKTDIVSMIAAFYGMKGIGVDIDTNTFELASRDTKSSASLYNFLGVTSSINAITPNGTQVDSYNEALINYGTLAEIKLFKNTAIQSGKHLTKRRTILLADEFDADRDNQSLFRLSRTPEFKNVKNVTACLRVMLELMVDFVDDEKQDGVNVFNPGQKSEAQQKQDRENFKKFISRKTAEKLEEVNKARGSKKEQLYSRLREFENLEQTYEMIGQIDHNEIIQLLNNCHASKQALAEWKIGEQYNEIPRYMLSDTQDSIKCINGILPIVGGKFNRNNWNSQFSAGLQQFIAIRKNKALHGNSNIYYYVEPFTSTSAVDAPSNLLLGGEGREYERVIGLSGTGGNESEIERMENILGMNSLFYPEHKKMTKTGLFEKEDYKFLESTSRTRFDKYVLLARTEDEKIDYLINTIKHTIKYGKADPFLILCNNHEEVYKYQKKLAEKIESDTSLRAAIAGIQTSGLGSMKSFNSETRAMFSQDEEHYLALRKKLGISGDGDRRKSLHERIIDQASLAGVITFGTTGNNSRGTDIKKHEKEPRELTTVVFGCNKELLTPSLLIQSLGRTFGRFQGRAGVIVTIDEVLSELKKLGTEVEATDIIVQHFYELMNEIAANNTRIREKNRVFNIVWEIIQKTFHEKITDLNSASKTVTDLIAIYQNLSHEWSIASKSDKAYPAFCQKALDALAQLGNNDVINELTATFEKEGKKHDFSEFIPKQNTILKPGPNPYAHSFKGLEHHVLLKLITIATPIGLMMWNSRALILLAPIISGALHGFLFQYPDSVENDKASKLRVWHYNPQLTLASTLADTATGILSVSLPYLIQMGCTVLAQHTSFKLVKLVADADITVSAGLTCATAILGYNRLRKIALDIVDSRASFNLPPGIQIE